MAGHDEKELDPRMDHNFVNISLLPSLPMCWAANPLADIHADCDMWICVIDCKLVSLNDIIQRYFKVFYSSEFGRKKCVGRAVVLEIYSLAR